MRIAVLSGYTPSLITFRGPMIKAMVDAGHQVVGLGPEADPAVEAALAELGARFRPVPLGRTGLNPLRDLATLRALVQVFRELRPDLVLSYTIKPVIYGSLAAAWAGVPHRHAMITGLGSSLQGGGVKERLLGLVARWLYRKGMAKVEGVFFQNPDDQAFFEAHKLLAGGCRITRINGSGVDLGHFAPCPMPDGPPTFLMMARLARDKGVNDYAEAARILKAAHPEVRCLLVGPFDSNPSAISRKTVDGWVQEGILDYLGPAQDVRPFLARCQVYVLPSYGEGTPRSVLEAMAVGRAVVSTRVAGCKETVLDGESGFLVPARDPAAVAAAMARFVEDPRLAARMGAVGHGLAVEKFDVVKVNQVILGALGIQPNENAIDQRAS